MARLLSKSRLLAFLQCPRRLWLETYRPDLAAVDAARQAQFESGHRVGAIARELYAAPLPGAGEPMALDTRGQLLLPFAGEAGVQVLFEPQFTRADVLIRADVLEQSATRRRLIEVKASSSLKPHHLADCAIQAWVLEGAGCAPTNVVVAHIDDQFLYGGDGNYRGLLTEADVTAQVVAITPGVPVWARDAQAMLDGDEPPIPVGRRCFSPHECPFIAHCWPKSEYPLTSLPRVGKQLDVYVARGYRDLRDVPELELTSAEAVRVWRATRSNRAELNPALREELAAIAYPRYYLDFETIAPVVPLWPGTRPRQAIPYQWSIHVEPAPGVLEHLEYLDLTGDLPARGVADSIVRALGTRGPILTYSDYERQCLNTLALLVPDFSPQLEALAGRLVNLLPIVKRSYYHPAMRGSWSIKRVLPTVVPEMRYENLGEVQEGQGAERAYLEAISAATSPSRREEIRRALLAYCRFDTEAMVKLVLAFSTDRAPVLS
jgi:hypothetical protein